jgi:hypothetical protein
VQGYEPPDALSCDTHASGLVSWWVTISSKEGDLLDKSDDFSFLCQQSEEQILRKFGEQLSEFASHIERNAWRAFWNRRQTELVSGPEEIARQFLMT